MLSETNRKIIDLDCDLCAFVNVKTHQKQSHIMMSRFKKFRLFFVLFWFSFRFFLNVDLIYFFRSRHNSSVTARVFFLFVFCKFFSECSNVVLAKSTVNCTLFFSDLVRIFVCPRFAQKKMWKNGRNMNKMKEKESMILIETSFRNSFKTFKQIFFFVSLSVWPSSYGCEEVIINGYSISNKNDVDVILGLK